MSKLTRRPDDDQAGHATTARNSALSTQHSALQTTDPQDELFDILDQGGRPTGVAKRRGEVHRDGDWHGALHIWVGGVGDDGTAFVVFQRRSLTKDTWPGYLDTAIGGHIRSGETLEETVREAEEEIGLAVTLAGLTLVGRRAINASRGRVIDREVQSIYAVRCDQPLQAYRLHPEEVDAIVSIALDGALDLFAGERDTVPASECPRDGEPFNIVLTREDFAIRDRQYVMATLPALGGVLRGETPEAYEVRTSISAAWEY